MNVNVNAMQQRILPGAIGERKHARRMIEQIIEAYCNSKLNVPQRRLLAALVGTDPSKFAIIKPRNMWIR